METTRIYQARGQVLPFLTSPAPAVTNPHWPEHGIYFPLQTSLPLAPRQYSTLFPNLFLSEPSLLYIHSLSNISQDTLHARHPRRYEECASEHNVQTPLPPLSLAPLPTSWLSLPFRGSPLGALLFLRAPHQSHHTHLFSHASALPVCWRHSELHLHAYHLSLVWTPKRCHFWATYVSTSETQQVWPGHLRLTCQSFISIFFPNARSWEDSDSCLPHADMPRLSWFRSAVATTLDSILFL